MQNSSYNWTGRGGAWTKGEVLGSFGSIGYRVNNTVYRFNSDNHKYQDWFQNFVHKYIARDTPYYRGNYNKSATNFLNYGSYNQFIW